MIEKSPKEVKDIIDNTKNHPMILDVREQWEYDICHIENSTHIPMGKIVSVEGELSINMKIIVVCHHGIRLSLIHI